jgi:DNA polymerase-3 subunit epsilon
MRMITNGHADVTSTIAIIDFETTGLDPHRGDRPTEVAVVFVRNKQIVDQYQRLINPGRSIPSFVTSLTGITNAMVRNAPPVGIVMEELHQKIGDTPLIAHNASFDKKFLDTELERIGRERRQDFTCSMRVARRVLRSASNFKLGTLVEHVGLTFSSNAHRALADAEMTAKLWIAMERTLQKRFSLQNVPLTLLNRLQSVTIAKADQYVRNYARTQHRPVGN